MANQYDFVVLGGGHNGLVAAAYLGKAGFKVCVLESNDEFGGGTRSGEVTAPGYISDLGGMVHSMIARNPMITNDELQLQSKYGLRYINAPNLFGSIFPDDTHLIIDHSFEKTCENIAKFSQKDAETYRKYAEYVGKLIRVAAVGAASPPPKYSLMHSVMGSSPEGLEFARMMQMSAQDVAEEWFESPKVRAAFTRWPTELMINPRSIGTGTMMFFVAYAHNPAGAAPFPEGGARRLVEALENCCKDFGVELFTNAKAVKLNVSDGEAKSVVTADGQEYVAAKAVVSTINIKYVYDTMLGNAASPAEADHVRKLKHSEFMPLNQSFAIKKVPEFKWPEMAEVFCVEGAPFEDEYLKTFSDYKYGDFKANMPLVTIPSLWDSTRCPAGHSVINVYHYAPWDLYGDAQNWIKYKQELADQVWDFTKKWFTNICDDDIVGRWIITPLEYETWDPGFIHGDIGQIGMQPSQMYDLRPFPGRGHEYHGDIDNLYFVGSSGHPGGGIAAGARTGIQIVLDDYGVDFRSLIK